MVMRLGSFEAVCDSCYLLLDTGSGAVESRPSTREAALLRLLEQWRLHATSARERDTLYLPFDFSDQCTGWVRCEFDGASVTMTRGYSEIEGWSFLPSDIRAHVRAVADFDPTDEGAPVTVGRDALLRAIAANLRRYGGDLSKEPGDDVGARSPKRPSG